MVNRDATNRSSFLFAIEADIRTGAYGAMAGNLRYQLMP